MITKEYQTDLKGEVTPEIVDRCQVCFKEGVYGEDLTDVEYVVNGYTQTMVACKDTDACWERCGGWNKVGPR